MRGKTVDCSTAAMPSDPRSDANRPLGAWLSFVIWSKVSMLPPFARPSCTYNAIGSQMI